MNPVGLFEERVLFSPNLPPEVNRILQMAVAASHSEKPMAEKLFKQAQETDRSCLQTYFALYKFYFYQGRLQEAEREAMAALDEASRQGGFPSDYRLLVQQQPVQDMYANEASLFYLYSLKALAFINLRLGQMVEAKQILADIKVLDPEDRSGASVIMKLSEAFDDDLEAA